MYLLALACVPACTDLCVDIIPTTVVEMLWAMVTMAMAALFFAFIIGSFVRTMLETGEMKGRGAGGRLDVEVPRSPQPTSVYSNS